MFFFSFDFSSWWCPYPPTTFPLELRKKRRGKTAVEDGSEAEDNEEGDVFYLIEGYRVMYDYWRKFLDDNLRRCYAYIKGVLLESWVTMGNMAHKSMPTGDDPHPSSSPPSDRSTSESEATFANDEALIYTSAVEVEAEAEAGRKELEAPPSRSPRRRSNGGEENTTGSGQENQTHSTPTSNQQLQLHRRRSTRLTPSASSSKWFLQVMLIVLNQSARQPSKRDLWMGF